MELTKNERLILINQYEILKRLDPEEADRYEQYIDILSKGFQSLYSELDEFLDDDMPLEDSTLVLETLSMYRAIENYKRTHPDDKEVMNHHYTHFLGFDGNEETRYMAFAKFFIIDLDRFAEQRIYALGTDNFNSHYPYIDKYRAMIDKWHSAQEQYELSREEVLAILNAR